MDATTRWETEAIRSSPQKRTTPPRPTAKRKGSSHGSGTWVTLKEAEIETGIPSNTLRKWVRKDAIESYLESDGELSLRMVNLDSVIARAETLGRPVEKAEDRPAPTAYRLPPTVSEERETEKAQNTKQSTVDRPPSTEPEKRKTEKAEDGGQRTEDRPESPEAVVPEGSLLVPLDAWNKMVNQLGNLHEAGQQLAEARERAAKAETEALFLRERLSELRDVQAAAKVEAVADNGPPIRPAPQASVADPIEAFPSQPPSKETVQTTTYWRYLTTGWRDRKRSGDK
ncbi:MAG: hypothetical protein O3B42_07300 [Actinomycetota bacterium]|nr:hypothetical protein [Actinomycetota bacterium]